MRVAVVGATGAVGREMIRILEERSFPLDELVPLASSRSAGKALPFRGGEVRVQELGVAALATADLALVSAGAAVSGGGLPAAAASGTVCAEDSSALRMGADRPRGYPDVPPAGEGG